MDTAAALLDIRESPLSAIEVITAVSSPGVGGVGLFIGTVRETDHEREVAGLSYSAHPGAMAAMARVAAEVAAAFPVLGLAALHRVGELAVGDLAVVVAVGCEHRGEAIEACHRLIDEIKARVPIWKHQRFRDGGEEWVGVPDIGAG